jgi:hypothetical protein
MWNEFYTSQITWNIFWPNLILNHRFLRAEISYVLNLTIDIAKTVVAVEGMGFEPTVRIPDFLGFML